MNFLAHLYLSGQSDELKVGNFIGDFVKGAEYKKYPEEIRKGIMLHRQIDFFTDHHDQVRLSMERLRKKYHKYSGVITDIFYDHYLSVEWKTYSDESLSKFIRHSYYVLIKHYGILPDRLKRILPYLIARNKFASYAHLKGVKSSLDRMSKYTSLPDETAFAMRVLRNNYEDFRTDFNLFFPDMIEYATQVHQVKLDFFTTKVSMKENEFEIQQKVLDKQLITP